MENSSMDRLHEIQLEMALEVKRICEQHEIRYFLVAGTLLGAVRHQGFIPWDDDLDIAMPRDDYQRFIEVCKKELPRRYFLQTSSSEPEFGFLFAKMRKEHTRFVESNAQNVDIDHGVFIDIFPFDNAPDSTWLRHKHAFINHFLRRVLLAKLGYTIAKEGQYFKKFVYLALAMFAHLIRKDTLRHLIEANAQRYRHQATTSFVNLGGSYSYTIETLLKDWIFPLKTSLFEGYDLCVPQNTYAILTQFYGVYMKLPLQSDRQSRHLTVEVELDEAYHET